MHRGFRFLTTILLAAGAMALSPVRAATPEEGAAAAAQAWGRAIIAQDVDAQMKLLPATMFAKPSEMAWNRALRLHDKELAIVNKQKYLSFDVGAPSQTLKINKFTAVVMPYRAILSIPDGKMQNDSALIVLAEDGSDRWSVFDGTANGNVRTLRMLIPGYTTGLKVPPPVSRVIKGE